jgi:outer membrane protein OmpA-like peptidoglycan-associated protein
LPLRDADSLGKGAFGSSGVVTGAQQFPEAVARLPSACRPPGAEVRSSEIRKFLCTVQGVRSDALRSATQAEITNMLGTLRTMTGIAEHEIHEAVLSCTKARRGMLSGTVRHCMEELEIDRAISCDNASKKLGHEGRSRNRGIHASTYNAAQPYMHMPVITTQLMENAMSRFSSSGARWGAIAALILLAACATERQPMQIGVYHVAFDTDSFSIDAAGQRTIDQVANAVTGNRAASITIVGRTDAAGSPAYNMQLSQKRAIAVHDALIATGKITPDQIETAWTREKLEVAGLANAIPAPGSRVVDIFIH